MRPLRVLDLFSGIGAYSLGLERTGGFETVAFCEIEPFPRKILAKHWPNVPIYEDVLTLSGERLAGDGIVPGWIVAGWPCQGNSSAGTGLGMDDPRSGLWSEIRRLAGEIRPIGLLLENSANLLTINGGRDFGRVLADLAALGFDAEWHCLPAAAFDAPHIRDRLWIVATAAHDARDADPRESAASRPQRQRTGAAGQSAALSDRQSVRCGSRRPEPAGKPRRPLADGDSPLADAYGLAPIGTAIARQERVSWEPEPDVARVVSGASDRVERVRALGNLNPPIIPEIIGRAILASLPGPKEQAA